MENSLKIIFLYAFFSNTDEFSGYLKGLIN